MAETNSTGGAFLLRDVLIKLGVSQRQLAKRLGATQDWVSRLYHGRNAPAWPTAVRIARALGVSVAVFNDNDPARLMFFQSPEENPFSAPPPPAKKKSKRRPARVSA